ncbi:alpha/beta hydrolase [Mycolicibacterium stellerae]|uniref:alpha/beta hydrolase n=1 Tax=Mycolicibacterium stellerae TaxID=2358193 RepID=UPI001F41FAF1|nr:alpha/beta hydrolase [Mycolicibacterium stellerae]
MLVSSIPMNARTLPIIRMLMAFKSRPQPGVTVAERHVGAIAVFVLTPTGQPVPRPGVLSLHGGGMCAGSAQLEIQPAGRLAHALGAVVVSPNYRLAPENPFPAGLDDCMATLQWMVSHAEELGIDPSRIAVCGTSAGGGLAAAVAQRAVDEGISVRAQALVSPMLDDRTALRDDLAGRGELTWTPKSNRWAWTAYLGREPRRSSAPEYAAPARRTDVAGLPPAWIGVGDLEVFFEENVAYAERLEAAGVPSQLVAVPGMYHTADGILQKVPSMRDFHASMVQFLRVHLDAPEWND